MQIRYLIKLFIILAFIFEAEYIFPQNSIFSKGKWLRIGIVESGVYKLDRSFFESYSSYFDVNKINPSSIQIYGSGYRGSLSQNINSKQFDTPIEMNIYFKGNDDEIFENNEYILFYADNSDNISNDSIKKEIVYSNNIYSDTSYYFLTFNQDEGKRVLSRNSIDNFSYSIDSSDELYIYENDINNILQSGRDWVGELFSSGDFIDFNISSTNIYNKNISIILRALSRSTENSRFIISVNNKNIGELNLDNIKEELYGDKVVFSEDTFDLEVEDLENLNVKITYSGSSKSLAYLDYLMVNYEKKIFYNSGQKIFKNFDALDYDKTQYKIETNEDITIWDISNPYNIVEQLYNEDFGNLIFNVISNKFSKFIIFNESDYLIPVYHSYAFDQYKQSKMNEILSHDNVELLIITHDLFIYDGNRLAEFRRKNDQLNVKVVTVDEIYNQFSSSMPDIVAIRNYVKYLYDKTSEKLKYVLLFGDASYDYKDRISNNTNFVPTYQSRNSTNNIYSYSSDDFFGFLETNEGEWEEDMSGDHTLDVGIGRIPVNNLEDSKKVVDKLISYNNQSKLLGNWKNNIYLIADDGDYNIHQIHAEDHFKSINSSHPEYDIKKIYIDFFEQELIGGIEKTLIGKFKLNEAIDNGSLILNYIGHGNEFLWAEERILDENTINSWRNRSKLPLFITATCEFGKFDDPLIVSGGEMMTIKGDGGAIALFTTTRPVFSTTNFKLNNEFYKHVFTKKNGKFLRLGDIFRIIKNNSLSGPINRNFSLLGDPSLILNYPKYDIELVIPDSLLLDTLSALDKKTFQGKILNNNQIIDDFNGEVFINFFDKLSSKQTLGDENDPFYFNEWDKSIFRGSSTVNNGNFNFEFVVPKNINYNFGNGKISMYAIDSLKNIDANGSNQEFIVGGTSKEFPLDETPPEIEIFFNDKTFTSGSVVGSNALLIVDLFDENGINIINSDFSNNIVARLDDSLDLILNDYFVSNKDDFKRGTIRYPLENLKIGKHKIEIKVYDTYNNLAKGSVLFVVSNDLKLNIYNLMNYPNPFSNSTSFIFEHDREDEDLEISIQIINLYGEVLYQHYEIIESSSKKIEAINWNGRGFNNQILSEGIYIYKLIVKSLFDGAYNTSYKKMIKRN